MADWDVIVIGAGTAGSRAARVAAQAGARVAAVNDGELGGLCILRGCMPTKAMLASAHALHEARHLEPFGLRMEGRVDPDFGRIVARKNEQVARFKAAKVRSIETGGYTLIDARARFAGPHEVALSTGEVLSARRIVIAAGSRPTIVPIPGIDSVPVMTSDDVMRLQDRQPRSMIVQGAGPIGLELAQFFARVGTDVHLVNRSPLLTRFGCADVGQELGRALEAEENMTVSTPGRIERVEPAGEQIDAWIESGGRTVQKRVDAFLMAAGRHAAVDDLDLEKAGIEHDGVRIAHDDALQTSNPDVFVAGDATNEHEILHVANIEGEVAGFNAAAGRPERRIDRRLLLSVIFTDPPFAHLGMTEREAEGHGRPAVVSVARFPETGRAITMSARFGVWKLVVCRETGEILGSSILGPRADDIVHVLSTAMYYHGTVVDLLDMPWYHPTLTEVILNLARDAEDARSV
jgi:pyruvate/2-oxoglutarate dehydrogenase complex dihydrolipoamide dehydrogenase (E3) component